MAFFFFFFAFLNVDELNEVDGSVLAFVCSGLSTWFFVFLLLMKSHNPPSQILALSKRIKSPAFSSRAGLVEMRCTFTLDALHAWLRLPG